MNIGQSAPISRHDTLIVVISVLVTSLPYVTTLGFYNDDWWFLAAYENAVHKDVWSLMRAAKEPMRPASAAYHALLYWLFQHNALGYHVTNTFVVAVSCGLFNTLLRRLGVHHSTAFALSIIWATLPHAATGRFWYAIFQMPASIALLFAAALCELQSLERRTWRWRSLSLLCVVVSGLLYEIALPLLALIPLVAARRTRRLHRFVGRRERLWWLAYPLTVGLLIAMKPLTTTRLEATTPASFGQWFLANLQGVFSAPNESAWGFNLWRALDIAFVELGVTLSSYSIQSAGDLGVGLEVAITAVLVAVTVVRLSWPGAQPPTVSPKQGVRYIAFGLCLFLLGWSVFLGSSSLQLTATGIGNRTAGAASIGVAFVFVGLIQSVASVARGGYSRFLIAMLSALTVGCGTLVVQRVAADWGRAWDREREILSQVRAQFPNGFSGRPLILAGVCQYVGPATVFEASWDLQWALRTTYSDAMIRAEVVTPSLDIRENELRTTLYDEEKVYKYPLIVYRPTSDVVGIIENADDAHTLFAPSDVDRDGGCPPGRIGHGVDVFGRRADVAYLAGFYDLERDRDGREWRWMDAMGTVSLRKTHRDMVLTIKGQVPGQVTEPSTITIMFNGRTLDTIQGIQTIDRHYDVPASAQGDWEYSTLRIRTDRTFVPQLVDPTSRDQRRLGFVLDHLSWEPRE